jgi:micrococcal nuclease
MIRTQLILGIAVAGVVALGALTQGSDHRAIDGDTIVHQGKRLRLEGIDAPEIKGHCRRGRVCVEGDPIASRDALQRLLDAGEVRCFGNRMDVYGRALVRCYVKTDVGQIDVNQGMLDLGMAQPYRRTE